MVEGASGSGSGRQGRGGERQTKVRRMRARRSAYGYPRLMQESGSVHNGSMHCANALQRSSPIAQHPTPVALPLAISIDIVVFRSPRPPPTLPQIAHIPFEFPPQAQQAQRRPQDVLQLANRGGLAEIHRHQRRCDNTRGDRHHHSSTFPRQLVRLAKRSQPGQLAIITASVHHGLRP